MSKRIATAALAALTLVALAACSGGTGATDSGATTGEATGSADQPITLKVVSLRPGAEKEAFDAFDKRVQEFQTANPNITIKSEEYEWTGPTFAAQLAGGTLPDVFTIPFTDGKTLIQNGQLADISAEVATLPYVDKFNPNVLQAGQDASGKIFAVPTEAYGSGLHYNRTLFTEAGLDPDKPPTTWEEVRADAKVIAEKTGQAGYATMTQSNTGGWQLTTATYTRGGRMEVADGEKTTVTVNNQGTKDALQFLHDLRWTDNSMGSNFMYDWGGINQAFAAGQIGMFTGGSDVYTSMVQSNGIKPEDYGLTALPMTDSADAGGLGGGTLAAVNVKAGDEIKAAAVKWIDFYYMQKLVDEDQAVADAKVLADTDQPVGTPKLPIFDQATYDQSLEWIKDYINVPLDQMTGFTDNIFSQALVAEPAVNTQELYAALDPVVQAVLTDKNADIAALLDKANTDVQAVVDKG